MIYDGGPSVWCSSNTHHQDEGQNNEGCQYKKALNVGVARPLIHHIFGHFPKMGIQFLRGAVSLFSGLRHSSRAKCARAEGANNSDETVHALSNFLSRSREFESHQSNVSQTVWYSSDDVELLSRLEERGYSEAERRRMLNRLTDIRELMVFSPDETERRKAEIARLLDLTV
ncbi:MAG: hypothetical protein KVP17_003567 [Porospora cf. gigantea B]|uniref:uncharacterized protein n=1 Tax=Porospora cf. gigantea B TaxID=2853592 RepID=UPI003571DF77|nr:MAG: hypothetical protein KVP17_003567 [Porospora cf. gigantea B]